LFEKPFHLFSTMRTFRTIRGRYAVIGGYTPGYLPQISGTVGAPERSDFPYRSIKSIEDEYYSYFRNGHYWWRNDPAACEDEAWKGYRRHEKRSQEASERSFQKHKAETAAIERGGRRPWQRRGSMRQRYIHYNVPKFKDYLL